MCYRTSRNAEACIVTGTVVDNRDAHQLYFGAVSRHPANPLTTGEEFVAVLEPRVGVIVLPAETTASFPVEVSLPDLSSVPKCVEGLPIAEQLPPNGASNP